MNGCIWILVIFAILFKETNNYKYDNGFEFVKGVWDGSKYTSLEKITYETDILKLESDWPSGPYSIPKSANGCPETRLKGWKEGYIDITWQQPHAVFSRTVEQMQSSNTSGDYVDITQKEHPSFQSNLIGPYSPYRMKLNFCSKTRNNESLDTGTWGNGNYSIYGDKSGCPKGFSWEMLDIKLHDILHFTYDGWLPEFYIQRKNHASVFTDFLEIRICTHIEEDIHVASTYIISQPEPFILLHSLQQSRNLSTECPQIPMTSVIEEVLSLQLKEENYDSSIFMRICYFQPTTWQHDHVATILDESFESLWKEKYVVRSISTTGKVSKKSDFRQYNRAYTYYDVSELLSYRLTSSLELHWKIIDVGRTVSLLGIFVRISDWPSDVDTDADFLRCFASNNKWDFIHFAAPVCTYKIKNVPQFRPVKENYGNVLLMQKTYEGRYFTLMSGSNLMIDTILSTEAELLIFVTGDILLSGDVKSCNIDMGMTDYGINNLQITSSSSHHEYPAGNVRPFHSSWCANEKDNNPFIQVDLKSVVKIEGITIWNRENIIESITNGSIFKQFVQIGARSFNVYYGESKENFTLYNNQVFTMLPMYRIDEPQTFTFLFPFRAQFIKIHVLEALTENLSCLRFELHGCRMTENIEYPLVAYKVIDRKLNLPNITLLTFVSVIKESAILTSFGYPLNYGGGESYKWLIQFEETKFIKLIFTDVNFNVYQESMDTPDGQDHVVLNEEENMYKEEEYFRRHVFDRYIFQRHGNCIVNNTFNGKIFAVYTNMNHLSITFVSFPLSKNVTNRGRGFRAIVLKDEIPACASLASFAKFSEDRYEYCDKPSMTLSSMSYFNMPFAKRMEQWIVYRKKGFLRVDIVYFNVICHQETIFTINEKKYCNLVKQRFNYFTSTTMTTESNTMTVTFKTENPHDMFQLRYTNIYDNVPSTITQKGADSYAIYQSILLEAVLTSDWEIVDLFHRRGQFLAPLVPAQNIPRLIYKACSEKFKKCYSVFSFRGSWEFASGECWIRKGRLVSIRSKEEHQLIKYLLRNFKFTIDEDSDDFQSVFRQDRTEFYNTYIGLRRKDKGNEIDAFLWENKSPLTFSAWANGEPSNGNCTRMGFYSANNDFTWETHNCLSDLAFYFVCEDRFNKTAREIRDRSVTHLYTGNASTTANGYTCQRWDSQYPHQHFYTDRLFPDRTISEASNFCRDPSRSRILWCFTTHPTIEWDICRLNELNEAATPYGYHGYLDKTSQGHKCESRKDNLFGYEQKYCRNPHISRSQYNYPSLWCYSKINDEYSKEMCSFKDTASDRCLNLHQSYKGHKNVTASEKSCQRWDMFYTPDDFALLQFPDNDLHNASNYCRDPTLKGFPWCYTTYKGKQWEICTIERSNNFNNSAEADIKSTLNYFKCKDGQPVDSYKRCNGVIDCDDCSDEIHCVEKNHPFIFNIFSTSLKMQKSNITGEKKLPSIDTVSSLFLCKSQEYISLISLCDGVIDCIDASDETNCSQTMRDNGLCGIDQFRCGDGNCIHVSLVCNFISDCVDSSDELCEYPLCAKEEYTCKSGQCIPLSLRCDASPDCLDESDEINCEPNISNIFSTDKSSRRRTTLSLLRDTLKGSCSSSAFHCDYVRCLPERMVCDKYPDCTDGRDEQFCSNLQSTSCIEWWTAGFRESGMYILYVLHVGVIRGTPIQVHCGFDSVFSHNEVYTTFQNIDTLKRDDNFISYTSSWEEDTLDLVIDFFNEDKRTVYCSREIVQSCNPLLQIISMTNDPDFEHDYSHCKCLIITLVLGREPEISSVRYCNGSDELDVDETDNMLLFDYKSTDFYGAFARKNMSVNYDDIHLSIGDVTCTQEYLSEDLLMSCADGVNILTESEMCVYDMDKSGLLTACRSGTHLQDCGNTKCAKGNVQCPGSYCIPLKFLCDGLGHCPNAEDEIGCGCEDSEREVLIVHEKDDKRGPDFQMLVKQLYTPKSIIRSIEYSSYMLPEGVAFAHRMLNIKDKEMKPFEHIDRNYECEYKILANDFLASIAFTQTFKRSILFIQSSPMSELVADLMFSNIIENLNINIYRAMESPNVTNGNKFNFVHDVRVSNWKILSSLASRYLPEICKEEFTTSCPDYYKCSSSKMCIALNQVCDGVRDCIYGDDEVLCDFNCPEQCICAGYTIRCSILNETALTLFPKQTRSLTLKENRGKYNSLCKEYLNFQFLYKFNASSCKINEIQPNAFSKLINLRVLDLSNNLITTLFPSVFSGLQRLTTLILDGNSNLATLESYTFRSLNSIKVLRIASTKVKTIAPNTFAGLNLDILEIHDNYFEYIEKCGIGNLSVEKISLKMNRIVSFNKLMFTGVSSLKVLDTPAYKYCCVRPNYLPEDNCFPQRDEFSSCEDLMRISVLQTMLWIIGLCALLGNILSFIYRLYFDRERLKLGYGIFVTNLAAADFLMGIYLLMIAIADAVFRKRYIFMDDYWRNSVWCALAGVLSTLSSEASVVFLCLITLDRLLVIKYPFGQVRFTTKKAVIFSIVAWLFCLFISIFPLLYATYFNDSFYNKSGVCIALPLTRDRPPGWLYSVFIFVVFNFATFLLVALGQWSIFMNIRNSKTTLKNTQACRKRDLIIARNLLLVVSTDFLCWFPIGCIGLMAMSGTIISGDIYAWAVVFILPVNSALNPVLYTLTAILGKKSFTPRTDEQSRTTIRTNIGKRFLINKAVIMSRFYVPGNSHPASINTNFIEIVQVMKILSPHMVLRMAYQIAQTLHVLHKNSLVLGKIEERFIFVKTANNKITGNVQLQQEPIICKHLSETYNDMYEFGLLLRTFIRHCKSDKE